ncbi:MAG: trigger factor [Candidatus Omnitrophota bacterium]
MKSRIKKLEGTARQFEIEMPKDVVESVFNQVIEDIRKTAKIPGFRPGKAPQDIIRKNYQKDAMDEVKQRLVSEAYQEALKEHNVSPVSYPEVSDVIVGPSGNLSFKAKVDAHPEVNLKKYKALKVATQKVSVANDEVEEALTRIRNMYAEFVDMDGPLRKGDFGICDVETFMDGEVISKKRENMWIEVSKEASMLGMGEELCGMEKGQQKNVEATLPENYPDKKYAGKKAVFHIMIKEAKEKKLPEFDDDLAKKLGKGNMDEVREELRSQLMEKKESNAKIDMKNQILDQLLQQYSLSLPASMVNRQLKVLMKKAEDELAQKGVDKQTIDDHKEKLKDQLLKDAQNKVKSYFILDRIAANEEIETSEEDVDNWLNALAASYSQSFEKVKKYYEEHDLIEGLKEQLREEKTLDFLFEEAVIKEKGK